MKKLFGVLLTIHASILLGQNLDTLSVDSVEKIPPPYYGGIFIDASIHLVPSLNGYNFTTNPGLWIQYNNIIAGFSQSNFEGTLEARVIFPNLFEMDYRHAGPHLGYQLHRGRLLTAELTASYRWGDMVWIRKVTKEDFIRDRFNLVVFTGSISLNSLRYTKPYIVVGYQKMDDLSIPLLESEDFSGVFFGLGIRIGYFNQ